MTEPVGYVVTLEMGRTRKVEILEQGSPQAACLMAEKMHPEFRTIEVRRTWRPIAHCTLCQSPIFEGDNHRHRRGHIRCSGC